MIAAEELPTKVLANVPGMPAYEMDVKWTVDSTSAAYDAKGATYVAKGELVGDNNVDSSHDFTVNIVIGAVTLNRPSWIAVPGQIMVNVDGGRE
jgi:hypothetical protein